MTPLLSLQYLGIALGSVNDACLVYCGISNVAHNHWPSPRTEYSGFTREAYGDNHAGLKPDTTILVASAYDDSGLDGLRSDCELKFEPITEN